MIQILHQRERRKVFIVNPPGSIGVIASLTARSGFGELLFPHDNEATLHRKLRGLTFRLDKRTGAIVADDALIYDNDWDTDDARLSLLGKNHSRNTSVSHVSSSTALASQAASGYPPWKTPDDR